MYQALKEDRIKHLIIYKYCEACVGVNEYNVLGRNVQAISDIYEHFVSCNLFLVFFMCASKKFLKQIYMKLITETS